MGKKNECTNLVLDGIMKKELVVNEDVCKKFKINSSEYCICWRRC